MTNICCWLPLTLIQSPNELIINWIYLAANGVQNKMLNVMVSVNTKINTKFSSCLLNLQVFPLQHRQLINNLGYSSRGFTEKKTSIRVLLRIWIHVGMRFTKLLKRAPT